ncbi:MAG: C-GCAxxG-C-C family protein [Clostridiales bacterium]|nr:C-GCAxxG-C-C family protein [Clostridiales bacterium]
MRENEVSSKVENDVSSEAEDARQLNGTRVQDAVALFEIGYNCAQSVFAAYADLFGMDMKTALKMSSAMGAGVGRMREVCGVVSSMAMLAGLKEGNDDPENEEAKAHIYGLVRRMSAEFRTQHGTIICRELLGIEGMEESAKPSIRTPEFYASRPCRKLIAHAAQIIEDTLLTQD